jgi:hypothetical protein
MHLARFMAITALVLTTLNSFSAVTHWRIIKGAYYLQSADNTPDATTTNWGMFGVVETDLPGDADSVVITGGNISGSIAYVLEGSEWELGADYTSKAALDAVFPSDASYSIILSGGTLGSLTQQVVFSEDAYPNTPYLTGADYSDCLALEALEPFELNWNDSGIPGGAIGIQVNTGDELDEGDTIFEFIQWNGITSTNLPWNLFVANSNYNGYIDFANANLQSGTGGFGIDGDVSFNTSLAFYINPVNTAVEYDDFDGGTNSSWFPFLFEAGKGFVATNDVLEFISDSSSDADSTAWIYDDAALSYTQDWSVAIDLANYIDQSALSNSQEVYIGFVTGSEDLNYLFSIETYMNPFVYEIFSGADSNGVEEVIEASAAINTNRVSVKISFDADTKLLTSAYSYGGDFSVLTNFSAAGWGLTGASNFLAAIYCGTDGLAVGPAEIYADNFRIREGRVLSNEVEIVELEFLHSYGDGAVFLPDNFIKAESDSTHRIVSMDVTTSGGDEFNVPLDWVEGDTRYWDTNISLGFSTSWDSANDGDWTVTYGFSDGTFQSIIVPFTKEDGTTPLPNFFYQPMFLAPSPANGLITSDTSHSFAWTAAGSNANHIGVDKIVDGSDDDETELHFYDILPGDSELIAGVTNNGALSTTNYGSIVFEEGLQRMRINEGYGRGAYTDEGVPYIVVKLNEADIIFTITADVDGDDMDDSWEVDFFGGTNAVDGGATDDFDGDGMLNVEEFIAGVNPTNGSSVFAVEEPGPSPAGFVINWNSVEGREYAVYWAKTLTNTFESVTPGYLPYPQNSYTDTVHTVEGCGFYFIDVRLD